MKHLSPWSLVGVLLASIFVSLPAYAAVDIQFKNYGGHLSVTYPQLLGSQASAGVAKGSLGIGVHGQVWEASIFQLRGSIDYYAFRTNITGAAAEYEWLLSGQMLFAAYLGPIFVGLGAGMGTWTYFTGGGSFERVVPMVIGAAGLGFGPTKNFFFEIRPMLDAGVSKPLERVYWAASFGISF